MQFSRDGELFRVVRITGPTHNVLAVKYGVDGAARVVPYRPTVTDGLSPDAVRAQVLAGTARANQELLTDYLVEEIRFLPTDSPPVEIYQELALRLAEYMHTMVSRSSGNGDGPL